MALAKARQKATASAARKPKPPIPTPCSRATIVTWLTTTPIEVANSCQKPSFPRAAISGGHRLERALDRIAQQLDLRALDGEGGREDDVAAGGPHHRAALVGLAGDLRDFPRAPG